MNPDTNQALSIAFVVGAFPKLSETFILDQVIGLMKRGCAVDVYAERPEKAENLHPEVVSFGVMQRTFFARRGADHRSTISVLGDSLSMLRTVPRKAVPLLRSLNLFRYGKDAVKLRWLRRVLAIDPQRSYDIVHGHFGPNGLKALELQRMGLLKGPLVVSFHGYDLSRWLLEHGPERYNRLFLEGTRFLPISDFWRDKLVALGCPPEKIRVQRMGIDCHAFSFAPRKYQDGDIVRLISVCRLTEKKGIEYAISAVAQVAKSFPISYTIVGDGPLRPELESQINDLGVSRFVTITGRKLRSEVIELLGEAHALLAPSVTAADGDMEGIPVTIMEAMARGLPVLSTRHSGIPELVVDRDNGYLAPERDVDALADCLRSFVSHPERWEEMGSNGRRHVERCFNVERLNDALVEVYRELLE